MPVFYLDRRMIELNKAILAAMIKNIIFDFGGVLFNIDFKKTFEAFKKLGYEDFEEMYSQHAAGPLFQDLETGKISDKEFYTQLSEILPHPSTNEQLKNAWNALLIGYRQPSLGFLETLAADYNLYLLSNTNAIHYEYFSKMLVDETKYEKLEDFFIKAWYSHEIHRRKPDVETYEFVLNDAGIKAEETLFIDDSHSNLPNAERAGIKTHLLKPGEKIENIDYTKF